jgi:hypothetical protein
MTVISDAVDMGATVVTGAVATLLRLPKMADE